MNVFISWSGALGHFSAHLITELLKRAFGEDVSPYFSPISIQPGEDFFRANQKALTSAKFGLILVTRDSLRSHWVSYEAGYLFTARKRNCMALLLGIDNVDIAPHPFAHRQLSQCNAQSLEALLKTLAAQIPADVAMAPSGFSTVATEFGQRLSGLCRADMEVQHAKDEEFGDVFMRDTELQEACDHLSEAGLTRGEIVNWMSDLEGIDQTRYAPYLPET